MSERLSTGVLDFDRELDGGIKSGSILSVVAPSDSQSELILDSFMREHPTLYLATNRTQESVNDIYTDKGMTEDTHSLFIKNIDIFDVDEEDMANQSKKYVDAFFSAIENGEIDADKFCIIIDPINPYEDNGKEAVVRLLRMLQKRVNDTDKHPIVVIHALDELNTSPRRATLNISDVVFKLKSIRESRDVENYLYVTKYRGGSALSEALKVELGNTLDIDTSRDIA